MKLLGMIGGTSWHSTVVYYRMINELVEEKIGTQANPPLLLYSLNIELMRSGDVANIKQNYLQIAQTLQDAGAEAIVICANTPHLVYDYVQPKIEVPILHIAEATGREARRLGLQKLGLLGNRPTMTGQFIPAYLQEHFQLDTIVPEEAVIRQSHQYVSKELTQGRFTEEARAFYLDQIAAFRAQGADGVILGCTELPILLREDKVDFPLMATTDLHARLAAEFILDIAATK